VGGCCSGPGRFMRILGPAWMGGALCIDPEAASFKLQALTAGPGYDRMNLERNNYGQ